MVANAPKYMGANPKIVGNSPEIYQGIPKDWESALKY